LAALAADVLEALAVLADPVALVVEDLAASAAVQAALAVDPAVLADQEALVVDRVASRCPCLTTIIL
jgi:hypothetical protein